MCHLGPAMATLARLKELDDNGPWRADAEALLASTRAAQAANSEELWRDVIRVPAFTGREAAIASMIDYSCRLSERTLDRALADEAYLTAENLRTDYFDGPADDLPVPFNRVMVATFFLTGMDISHRLIDWFDQLDLEWERAMVIIAGRAGPADIGCHAATATVLPGPSRRRHGGRLPAAHLLIAPHAARASPCSTARTSMRSPRSNTTTGCCGRTRSPRSTSESSCSPGTRSRPQPPDRPALTPDAGSVDSMPLITSPTDWLAMTTR